MVEEEKKPQRHRPCVNFRTTSFNIGDELLAAVVAVARRRDQSRSAIVRRALREFVAREQVEAASEGDSAPAKPDAALEAAPVATNDDDSKDPNAAG